jgi:hypothetical protein
MSRIMIHRPVCIPFCSRFIFLQGDGNYPVEVVLESFFFLECDNRYIYIVYPPVCISSMVGNKPRTAKSRKFDSILNNL